MYRTMPARFEIEPPDEFCFKLNGQIARDGRWIHAAPDNHPFRWCRSRINAPHPEAAREFGVVVVTGCITPKPRVIKQVVKEIAAERFAVLPVSKLLKERAFNVAPTEPINDQLSRILDNKIFIL